MATFQHIKAPVSGTLLQWQVAPGDAVAKGQMLAVIDAMKMEHEVLAPCAGVVGALGAHVGESIEAAQLLLKLEQTSAVDVGQSAKNAIFSSVSGVAASPRGCADPPSATRPMKELVPTVSTEPSASTEAFESPASTNPEILRPDLQRLKARLAFTTDAARPAAMAKRQAQGSRSARANVADLCDAGSFIEYGALAVAAQAKRRSPDDLVANTPADGMVTGLGRINGALFGDATSPRTQAVVMAYDATVLAGTQGMRNHQKTDRMLGIAWRQRLPVVLFAEGGGGRPGDVDMPIVAGLHVPTFASFARLAGRVPVVAVVHGRCFAGNAALAGCADAIVATQASNLGMGGPTMVEGGGLGVFSPEQIGPAAVQHANGVIDILVADEAAAVEATRQWLSFFQGRAPIWRAPVAKDLRSVVPQQRLRAYDTTAAIDGIADVGSALYLRTGYGQGVHTALARMEGRPMGVVANNPMHLGGALDAAACHKMARFLRMCNAHHLPVLCLVDTPGFMVGPDTEATGQVRAAGELFVAAAQLAVPVASVVLRKGYGLGAMAMTAGGFHAPLLNVAWPSAEFGAMGLEGAVKLGYRKELEAAPHGPARDDLYAQLVASQYEAGSAINMAQTLEIDAVIDPADTRRMVASVLFGGA